MKTAFENHIDALLAENIENGYDPKAENRRVVETREGSGRFVVERLMPCTDGTPRWQQATPKGVSYRTYEKVYNSKA